MSKRKPAAGPSVAPTPESVPAAPAPEDRFHAAALVDPVLTAARRGQLAGHTPPACYDDAWDAWIAANPTAAYPMTIIASPERIADLRARKQRQRQKQLDRENRQQLGKS